jgi:hypothetical protein
MPNDQGVWLLAAVTGGAALGLVVVLVKTLRS